MNETNGQIVPFLLIAIFSVILINLLVNVCLFYFSKIKNIKIVCFYWGSLLGTYLLQGQLQQGELAIALGFSASFIPVTIISKILFDSINKRFPLKRYLLIFATGLTATVMLSLSGSPFTVVALPVCLAINAPLLESAFHVLVSRRQATTVLQKFMSIQYVLSAIHVFNFALFRMQPGTQVFGFGTALVLYQIMSITLFAFAFEEYSKEEVNRLQILVKDRTKEITQTNEQLQSALKIKDTLLKVVLHDIANPIQAQTVTVSMLERSPAALSELLPRLSKFNSMIKNIIHQVRSMELINSGHMNLERTPVNLEQCLKDVLLVFEDHLKEKNLHFSFQNELRPETHIAANSTVFTNSVMNNLVSNAIKFSKPGSHLKVRAFERNEKVVIEVEDQGIGMPQEMIFDLFNPLKKKTRVGTNGEKGSGYGLPLVKSYIEHFGGDIDVESRPIDQFPMNHGTKFTLTLDKLSHLQ